MRRRLSFLVPALLGAAIGAAACGLDVVGTAPLAERGVDASASFAADASTSAPEAGPAEDASVLDAGLDGEAFRPDAGVLFVPSHVGPTSYRLDAPDLVVPFGTTTVIDTAAGTITVTPGGPTSSAALRLEGAVAVLSVGQLLVQGTLRVQGARALAIVASGTVTIDGTLDAHAEGRVAGPAGGAPGAGVDGAASAGKNGGTANGEWGGGGGGGNGQAGGEGGSATPANRGAAGAVANATGALLVGGAGGGRGARATNACAGRGIGGAGGGAVQISSVKSITLAVTGLLAVGGGGARGGCRDNGGNTRTAGGGGGAGGTVLLESVTGVVLAGTVDARGGGGGEGGGNNDDGSDGESASPSVLGTALGGLGGSEGGGGGNGATGSFAAEAGEADPDSSGGGGGGLGRLFLRARGSTSIDVQVSATLAAVRVDGAF